MTLKRLHSRRIGSRKAASITEAIIAAVIFAIAAAGIFSTISAVRDPGAESEHRVKAAYYAQEALEDLRAKVDQGTWASGDLTLGVHPLPDQGIYSGTYTVTAIDPGNEMSPRRVDVFVTWTPPTEDEGN